MKKILMILSLAALTSCAGKMSYVQPTAPTPATTVTTIARPLEAVWQASVRTLGTQFFVINTIDKSSGLINLSYAGDPEKYVDCGQITSYVKNAAGERTYEFPGARAAQFYEIMEGGDLFRLLRTMALQGRVTVLFEDLGPDQTRVTLNTRYVLTKEVKAQHVAARYPEYFTETIAFNAGGAAAFPSSNINGQATTCVATGQLEHDILTAIQ